MADQIFNVECGFFSAVNHDRLYGAEDMTRPYKRIVSDGVFPNNDGTPSNDLQVEASGNGMEIIVNAGEGIFAHKWFENPSAISITVPDNTSINPRIDSVIAQVDTTTSGRVGSIVYRTGTPSASPTPPDIGTVEGIIEYRIANVAVGASAVSISDADITDLRGSSECLWVTSLIYQVDTSTLFNQWQTAYQEFYEESTQTFEEYETQQRADWEAFLHDLTDDLTVNTSVMMLWNFYTTQSTTVTIPIGISGYNPSTDILMVFINGLLVLNEEMYELDATARTIDLAQPLPAGQTVKFVVLKSVTTGDLQTVQTMVQNIENEISGIVSDSGWINFTLGNDFSAVTNLNPAYRKVGDRVYIRGSITGFTTAGGTVFTLPPSYRPDMAHTYLTGAVSGSSVVGTVSVTISADGAITVDAISGTLTGSESISLSTDFAVG